MRGSRWLFVLLYTMSGAAALVYEVTWTRLLTLRMGHTGSAVSTVRAAVMGGLASGAWMAGRFPISGSRRLRTYAVLEFLIALIAIVLPLALRSTEPAIAWAYGDGETPMRFAFVRAALSFILLAVPAAAMGATFPIAASWFAELSARVKPDAIARSAADASVLYAANTAGAAAGAIGAGFWLIPSLGLRGTTWIGVALNGGAAAGALWLAQRDAIPGAQPVPTAIKPELKTRKRKKGQQPRRDRTSPLPDPRPALAWAAA